MNAVAPTPGEDAARRPCDETVPLHKAPQIVYVGLNDWGCAGRVRIHDGLVYPPVG